MVQNVEIMLKCQSNEQAQIIIRDLSTGQKLNTEK